MTYNLHPAEPIRSQKDELLVGVNPELLKKPHTRPFDRTGKPMKGWLPGSGKAWSSD